MIMGKIFVLITNQSTKQWIKHLSNVSRRNSRPQAKAQNSKNLIIENVSFSYNLTLVNINCSLPWSRLLSMWLDDILVLANSSVCPPMCSVGDSYILLYKADEV